MNKEVETKQIQVEITETLQRVIIVDVPVTPEISNAENIAISIAKRMYRDEEVVLCSDDYVGTSFSIIANK